MFIIQILLGIISTYFSNQLLMNQSVSTVLLIYTIIAICKIGYINGLILITTTYPILYGIIIVFGLLVMVD